MTKRPSMPSHEAAGASRERAATCGGCGLVCDDITAVLDERGALERLEGTCPLGDAWFADRLAPAAPLARIDGREAALDAALDEAAAILAGARAPLVYGLGRTTCETQRTAVALAEAIGATIDPAGALLDGASGMAYPARGASTATLGEVRDRAEIVVVWRADPVVTHPRLLERLRLPDPARPLVVVDARRTATAEHADTFLELAPERDVEALWTLRALVRGEPLAPPAASERPLADLAPRLRACRHVAILHHMRGHVEALGLNALVRDLCSVTHAVTLTLRHEANAAGAEDVLAWQTGYPAAVSFADGYPRANPGELGAPAVLSRGDADAALVVASDPLEDLPAAAAERLRAIPVVAIDATDTATARAARVAFTTGAPGVHRPGVVHRLDGVPVGLRAVLDSARPSDEEVLAAIAGRITPRGGDAA
jgi:formylmethanofuran dehydrogenase subunit B